MHACARCAAVPVHALCARRAQRPLPAPVHAEHGQGDQCRTWSVERDHAPHIQSSASDRDVSSVRE